MSIRSAACLPALFLAACSGGGNAVGDPPADVAVAPPERPAIDAAPPATPRDDRAVPRPAQVRLFRNWAVACDNGGACEAVSLQPQEAAIGPVGAAIRRGEGPGGGVVLTIRAADTDGAVAVSLDGRSLADGPVDDRGQLELTGERALGYVRAMANGQRLEVRPGEAAISLDGLAAALRYMDAGQDRAGTIGALVARGAATDLPAAPALPTVVAARPPQREAGAVPPALVARMREDAGCPADEFGPVSQEAHALDDRATLVLLSCGTGAYNVTFIPYVLRGESAEPATFDLRPTFGEDDGRAALVNPAFDAATGALRSAARGRGIGDCGVGQRFHWDGERFRLTSMQVMGECRGAIRWPTVWRARVERAG